MNENEIVNQDGMPTDIVDVPEPQMLAFVNPADMPDLDNASVGMSIEQKYYEFVKAGDSVRAVFNGIKSIVSKKDGQTKVIPAITFQNKNGVFLNAGASLVEQFSNIPPGTAVEITYTGKEKTNSGYNVNKFDVRLLNVVVKSHSVSVQPKLPASVVAKNDAVTAYWSKVKEMRMTQQDGQDHLNEFNNDFVAALKGLEAPF